MNKRCYSFVWVMAHVWRSYGTQVGGAVRRACVDSTYVLTTCDMTYSYAWYYSFMFVKRLFQMCDTTHPYKIEGVVWLGMCVCEKVVRAHTIRISWKEKVKSCLPTFPTLLVHIEKLCVSTQDSDFPKNLIKPYTRRHKHAHTRWWYSWMHPYNCVQFLNAYIQFVNALILECIKSWMHTYNSWMPTFFFVGGNTVCANSVEISISSSLG